MNTLRHLGRAFALVASSALLAAPVFAQNPTAMDHHHMSGMDMGLPPVVIPKGALFTDQLVRNNGLTSDRTTAIAKALDAAEQQTGAARAKSLTTLAGQVDRDVKGATDQQRVKTMAAEIRQLATSK